MTLDDAEAQFWRAVTEVREGRSQMAARRFHNVLEDYAATRAQQIVDEMFRAVTRRGAKRKAAS